MKKPEKNFDTGLRILEVLKILLNNDVSKNELIEQMNQNPLFENIYTFEAFIKYFNTLALFGLKIEKNKNIYKLINAFDKISLTNKELKVVVELINYIKKLHSKTAEKQIKDILYKSSKYMDENSRNSIISALNFSLGSIKSNNLINSLESILYDNRVILITYIKNNKTQETIKVILKEIIEKKDDIILVCYDKKNARNKRINAASIISVVQTPNLATHETFSNDSVIFQIYGRLAEVYKLKQDETIVDFTPEYKTILNKGEDRDIIIKRLLKYGENCRIIHPKSIKEEFLALTDELLQNLEEKVI